MATETNAVCPHCAGTDWTLQCVITSLVYAFGHDPEGPFRRECLVDRVRNPLFFCEGCGKEADAAIREVLETAYRSHDPERIHHPSQGGLLATLDDYETGEVHLVPPPVLSGRPDPS